MIEKLLDDQEITLVLSLNQPQSARPDITGTGLLFRDGGIGGIHLLGVVPEFRRCGIAHDLLLFMIDQAHETGCRRASLQASDLGISLYQSLGFQGETAIHNYLIKNS